MTPKIRSLNEFRAKLADSMALSLHDEGRANRLRKNSWLNRPYTRPGLAPAKEAIYLDALKRLARELSRVKEKERHKLAAQLHDDFGQDLVLTKMRLAELMNRLPPQYTRHLEGIGEIIAGLIRRTRAAIDELSPEHVCDTGLKPALQSLAEEVQRKHGLACVARLEELPRRLKSEVQQILFRAVRELLFNAVKHAHAGGAKILMARKDRSVTIEVCDDGHGFDRNRPEFSELSIGRFGLFSVRADLATIGADLRIFTRAGKGTRAIISVPLEAE